jgi:hypothetical protein
MFRNCKSFTGKGLERWDTSRLVSAMSMFKLVRRFNRIPERLVLDAWPSSLTTRSDDRRTSSTVM